MFKENLRFIRTLMTLIFYDLKRFVLKPPRLTIFQIESHSSFKRRRIINCNL